MIKADTEVLGMLHEAVAKDLLQRVRSGEATPAELNAAIKFLQNNNIEADIAESKTLSGLAMALPVFDDDDIEYTEARH
jgi:hypothetical protein